MQAVAAVEGEGEGGFPALAAGDRRVLLRLARAAVRAAVAGTELPRMEAEEVSPALREPRACFVTLHRGRVLRGCIGQLAAGEPLWEAVVCNAARAATRDWRFESVTAGEVEALRVEVSVLTPPMALPAMPAADLLERLRPGVDGVVLEVEGHRSTFLPQVWTDLPDKVGFMNRLAEKAGCGPDAWRSAGVRVAVYQVECFEEATAG